MTPDRRGHGATAELKRQIIILEGAVTVLGRSGCGGRLLSVGGRGYRGRSGLSRAYQHGTCRRCVPEAALEALLGVALWLGLLRVALGLSRGRLLIGRCLLIAALWLGLLRVAIGSRGRLLVGRCLRAVSRLLRVAL